MLVIVDMLLFSIFYYKLSGLSPEEYLAAGNYAGFNFWIDYLFWMFLIGLSFYLHKMRHRFIAEFSQTFNLNHKFQLRPIEIFFCDLLPLSLLVGVLAICLRYWP